MAGGCVPTLKAGDMPAACVQEHHSTLTKNCQYVKWNYSTDSLNNVDNDKPAAWRQEHHSTHTQYLGKSCKIRYWMNIQNTSSQTNKHRKKKQRSRLTQSIQTNKQTFKKKEKKERKKEKKKKERRKDIDLHNVYKQINKHCKNKQKRSKEILK